METDELAQHEEMGTALVEQYSIADVSSKVSFFKMEALEVGHLHDIFPVHQVWPKPSYKAQ